MSADEVLNLAEIDAGAAAQLLARYGLELRQVLSGETIPGSWWGDREAGLRGTVLHARPDTPVHSVLHEACHFVCMTPSRRLALNTDAGGDFDEENGVCYLQVLLADELPCVGRARMFADMDAWGYTFRLGSARAWFESDADDARAWLRARELIDDADRPTWRVRET